MAAWPRATVKPMDRSPRQFVSLVPGSMRCPRLVGLLGVLMALVACAVAPDSGARRATAPAPVAPLPVQPDPDLARLAEWFAGTWDNHAQVEAMSEAGSPAIERVHAVFEPVEVPAIGGVAFLGRLMLDEDPERTFRRRLYRFAIDAARGSVRLDQYSFVDEQPWRGQQAHASRLAALAAGDLRHVPSCAIHFRFDATSRRFLGSTDEGACRVESDRLGTAVTIEDRMEIGEDLLAVSSIARDESGRRVQGNAEGRPYRLRKARWYRGWVALHEAGPDALPGDTRWHMHENIVLHAEGRRHPISYTDGRRSGYSVQLARLELEGGRREVLALKLLNDATGQALGYAWSEPGTASLGLNMRWFQAGFRLVEGDPRFEP